MRPTRIIVTHYGGHNARRVGDVRVSLAAGVSLPDIMAREGVHPETPPLPFTPGWDLVGGVDRLGAGVSGIEPGQIVAALPISGQSGLPSVGCSDELVTNFLSVTFWYLLNNWG